MEQFPGFRFSGARLGMVVVYPPHERRKRHQYRLGASSCLQPKVRSSIIDQVELDIPTAPDQLKFTFAFGIRLTPSPFGNRYVGGKKRFAGPLDKPEDKVDPLVVDFCDALGIGHPRGVARDDIKEGR